MDKQLLEKALSDLREGKVIVVADDEKRENEGDLICASENVTGEAVNFMAKYGRGLICMRITMRRHLRFQSITRTQRREYPQMREQ